MSIEYLTAVWKDDYYTDKDKTKLLVMLAIADCADGNGFAFPGVEYLAKKSRCGTRSVQELCRELEKDEKLEIQAGKGRNGTNLYRVLGVQPLRGPKDSVSVEVVQPLRGATVAGCKVAAAEAPVKAAAEAAAGCTQTVRNHQEASGTTKKRQSLPTDDEWLRGLQTVLAYEHLNVAAEFSRAQQWCFPRNRKCTRRFFTDWLNRSSADRPMTATAPKSAPNYEIPGDAFLRSQGIPI